MECWSGQVVMAEDKSRGLIIYHTACGQHTQSSYLARQELCSSPQDLSSQQLSHSNSPMQVTSSSSSDTDQAAFADTEAALKTLLLPPTTSGPDTSLSSQATQGNGK